MVCHVPYCFSSVLASDSDVYVVPDDFPDDDERKVFARSSILCSFIMSI
jgi:hypothetical protein